MDDGSRGRGQPRYRFVLRCDLVPHAILREDAAGIPSYDGKASRSSVGHRSSSTFDRESTRRDERRQVAVRCLPGHVHGSSDLTCSPASISSEEVENSVAQARSGHGLIVKLWVCIVNLFSRKSTFTSGAGAA